MDKQTVKYAAAWLADTVKEAQGDYMSDLYAAAQKDPARHALMGAGLGALVGGAGGGLSSWLSRDPEKRRRGSVTRDALAGALLGGGLGAGAGVLPSLLKSVQEGTKPITGGVKTKGLVDSATSDLGNLLGWRTGAGAATGATVAGTGGFHRLRSKGRQAASALNPQQLEAVAGEMKLDLLKNFRGLDPAEAAKIMDKAQADHLAQVEKAVGGAAPLKGNPTEYLAALRRAETMMEKGFRPPISELSNALLKAKQEHAARVAPELIQKALRERTARGVVAGLVPESAKKLKSVQYLLGGAKPTTLGDYMRANKGAWHALGRSGKVTRGGAALGTVGLVALLSGLLGSKL